MPSLNMSIFHGTMGPGSAISERNKMYKVYKSINNIVIICSW